MKAKETFLKKRKKNDPMQKTQHHIIPRSRGGIDREDNIIYKPRLIHEAYHSLFANARPSEIEYLLQVVGYVLKERYRKAWQIVFGDIAPNKAIVILKNEWGYSRGEKQNLKWVRTKFARLFLRKYAI